MCKDPLHPFLQALPKCEHHMHVEGSLSHELLFTLAARNKVSLPTIDSDAAFASPAALLQRYDRFSSLDDFLHYYFIGMSCLITEQDFEQLAWEYFLKAKCDNVAHAEIFFDPQAHTSRGIQYDTIVAGFSKACRRAEKELKITNRLIVCFLRHLPVSDSLTAYQEVEKDLLANSLAGIGLSSSEKGFPPLKWSEIFQRAKSLGIRRTAHAGEEGPVEYMQEALRELHVERIDHGIKLADDKALMDEVAERKILITMCPLSNVRLRCVQRIADLPIRTYLDAGVAFSINSDDPAYFGGYIQDNYCAVQEAFKLTVQDWEWIARSAVDGSWCDQARKEALQSQISELIKGHSA